MIPTRRKKELLTWNILLTSPPLTAKSHKFSHGDLQKVWRWIFQDYETASRKLLTVRLRMLDYARAALPSCAALNEIAGLIENSI